MSNIKVTLKNIISLSTAEVASRILTVIYSIYLARVLMVENFGIFGSAKYLVVYFVLLSNMGLDSVGTREVAANKSQLKTIVDNLFTLRFLMGVVGYALLGLVTYFLPKSINEKIIILIFGINIFANNSLLNWVFQGLEKLDVYAFRTIITNLLNFVGILLFIHSPEDLRLATVIIVFSLTFNSFLLIIYYHRKIQPIKLAFDYKLWKKYFSEAYPIGIIFLIIGIYNFLPIVLLSLMTNNYYTGLYSSVTNVFLIVTLFSTVVQAVYYPQFAQNQNQTDRERTFSQFIRFMFTIGTFMPLFLLVFADKVVLIFGRDYSPAIPSIQIVMIAALVAYYSASMFCALLAWKHERKVIWAIFVGLVTTLLLNLLLIPNLFDRGAAIAALSGEISVFLVLAIIFYNTIQKLFLSQYLKLLIISVVSTIPFYLLKLDNYQTIFLMIASILIFMALIFLTKTITLSDIKRILNR